MHFETENCVQPSDILFVLMVTIMSGLLLLLAYMYTMMYNGCVAKFKGVIMCFSLTSSMVDELISGVQILPLRTLCQHFLCKVLQRLNGIV